MLGPTLDEDNLIVEDIDWYEAFSHFCAIGWKVIFSFVPPSSKGGGMPSFVAALAFIGMLTMIVGEFATVLGCVLGIEESVAAITLVALGTSLPDTFASMTAAQNSDDADAAIGNITGSNSVNVFLGLGLPWLLGTLYFDNKYKGAKPYEVPAGTLAFSVAVFLGVAIICFMILIARRCFIGGELGGPTTSKYASGCVLFFLWFIYILMSTLQAYDIIKIDMKGGI
jgi:solute carrier family 8 (sodium/calcium exchanger)